MAGMPYLFSFQQAQAHETLLTLQQAQECTMKKNNFGFSCVYRKNFITLHRQTKDNYRNNQRIMKRRKIELHIDWCDGSTIEIRYFDDKESAKEYCRENGISDYTIYNNN